MTYSREDFDRIEKESHRWPTVRPKGSKVKCPECGVEGWAGGAWTHNHLSHSECVCGKTVSFVGLARHTARCLRAQEALSSPAKEP